MKYYGQNQEDKFVCKYFNDKVSSCLSIGENNGVNLSNVLSSIEKGSSAVLVEPSPKAFNQLKQLHEGNPNVLCYQVAISDFDGEADFYESGEHLGVGDTSLLSSLDENEIKRWGDTTKFEKIPVKVQSWDTFYEKLPIKIFDLISIDAEGVDLMILKQMDLSQLKCKMLIVEWNSKYFEQYDNIATSFGMILYHKNAENLIYTL